MISPDKDKAIHRRWLNRLLSNVLDDDYLVKNLCFKGGTCAAMLGYLDRFSVDLDFDSEDGIDKLKARGILKKIFDKLALEIKDENRDELFYVLKYQNVENKRNSLKLEILGNHPRSNKYQPAHLRDVDRWAKCQTVETMFANKLVALVERFERHGMMTGRDVYDIHYFFNQNYDFDEEVVRERRGVGGVEYLGQAEKFIEKNLNETVINQDLNTLLPYEKFRKMRKILKDEVLMMIRMRREVGGIK